MAYFPLFIDPKKKKAIVFGKGKEAERKIKLLLDFGFDVETAEGFSEERLQPKPELVVSAVGDEKLAERIYNDCKEENIPINTVDNPHLCTFFFSANIKTKHLTIGVSTGGKAPGASKILRDRIKESISDDTDEIIEKISEIRENAKKEIPDAKIRREYINEKIEELLK